MNTMPLCFALRHRHQWNAFPTHEESLHYYTLGSLKYLSPLVNREERIPQQLMRDVLCHLIHFVSAQDVQIWEIFLWFAFDDTCT